MKIEDQVTTLELSKELKELGIEQKSLLYWFQDATTEKWSLGSFDIPQINFKPEYKELGSPTNAWWIEGFNDEYADDVKEYFSAFTLAELGEMLPWRVGYELKKIYFQKERSTIIVGEFWKGYIGTTNFTDAIVESQTEVDTRAKMIIYLKKKGLI